MKEFFKGVMHMTIEEMKEKKREHGYTYNMMSQMSGVPLGTVQKIFTGETKSPRYDTLEALARIFENGDRDYLYADMVEDSGTAYAAKVQGQYDSICEQIEQIHDIDAHALRHITLYKIRNKRRQNSANDQTSGTCSKVVG